MIKIGYARVSTYEQNLDAQVDALTKEGCTKIFTEKVSGVKSEKPQFEKLIEYARSGDTIVVYRLDRLGRNVKQLIELSEKLKEREINIKSLSESLDTSSPMGKMFFQLIAMFAELERNIVIERTNAGLSSARARGRTGGRTPGLAKHFQMIASEVKATYEKGGESTAEIRKIYRIGSQTTLYKILEFAGVKVEGFIKKRK